MNKPFTLPVAYENDVYGWALQQAALLRSGRVAEIDTENLAEEIEGVGASEYRELVSALRVLFIHHHRAPVPLGRVSVTRDSAGMLPTESCRITA
jgi:hypothetical protein